MKQRKVRNLDVPRSALALRWAMAAALAVAAAGASAQVAEPQNVLNLSASAQVEVPKDMLSVTLAATREGADAQTVQAALKQAMDAALGEARKAAKPGAVDVHTGNFSLFPRYGSKNTITGWQGSAELVIEGRDMPGIAQLAGRLNTVSISHVGYGLSREAREKVEADVSAEAVARYRAKASDLSKQFGFGGYSIREVSVSTSDSGGGPVPMAFMRAKAADAADSPLPVEAGKSTVTASVSGTVVMK